MQSPFKLDGVTFIALTVEQIKEMPEPAREELLSDIFSNCGFLTENYLTAEEAQEDPIPGMQPGINIVYLEELADALTSDEMWALIHYEHALVKIPCCEEIPSLCRYMIADAYAAGMMSSKTVRESMVKSVRTICELMHQYAPEFNADAVYADIMAQPDVAFRLKALVY